MVLSLVIALLVLTVIIFLQHPKFGRLPRGERLERIKQSANYKNGQFQNLVHTPNLTEGVSMAKVMMEFFFRKSRRDKPKEPVPSQKINLLNLDPQENVLVWFGHSSYFMQVDGKTILVDPVFSGHASPVKFTTKAFAGADVYDAGDFPEIDFLFITHDHWDHLDYETVLKLKPKVKKVITGLGTAAHLDYWGYDAAIIEERDWNEEVQLGDGFKASTLPARHFSGRGFTRNRSLWTSFVLQTPTMKIYMGGDSGYGNHFKSIGAEFGPFDLAILECGQYNEYWKYIHMMPHEVVQAAQDLKAEKLLPVHWGKFSISLHDWDEPILKVTAEADRQNVPLLTPMIGEKVSLNGPVSVFGKWWKEMK